MFDPPKTPKGPLCLEGQFVLAYIHSQMNLHMCDTFGANRVSRFVAFLEFVLICAGAPGRTVLRTDGVLLGKYDIINK